MSVMGNMVSFFMNPTKPNWGGVIFSVDKPCVLLAERRENNVFDIHISDPSQQLINLSLSIKAQDGSLAEKLVFFDQELKGKTGDITFSLTPVTSLKTALVDDENNLSYYSLSGQRISKMSIRTGEPYIEIGKAIKRIRYKSAGKSQF